MHPMQISFDLQGLSHKSQTPGLWVAYCPTLQVISQGETHDQARKNLVDAVKLFVEVCIARGTIYKVLEKLGFSVPTEVQHRPVTGGSEDDREMFPIRVPINLLQRGAVCQQ